MPCRVPCVAFAIAAALLGFTPGVAQADLDAFMKKPEPVYHWEKRGEQELAGCRIYDLHLVSQVWQGITWEHRIQIFRPETLAHPEFCALYNTGGSGSAGNTQLGIRMAKDSGAVYAILYNIPNQPLFGGKTEDGLVVYTWLKYMETGDESWPLHFPMAKAVLKAMDTIQAFSREARFPPITGFLIHGASKRGWTTWLAGASRDPRIKAIAPMVIDTLNVLKQGPHQLEAYGKLSEQIDDYTQAGIPEKLNTTAGRRLLALEDPYSYRARLTLPKLLILGTNDRYWSQDALNLYWDGLKGPKWVLYVPNSGHGLEDRERVYATLAAFIRMVAGGGRWPKMRWSYMESADGADLSLRSDPPPTEARLFHVQAKTKDFRDSRWSFDPMAHATGGFAGHSPLPAEGYTANFGEAVYNLDGHPFTLSTQIRIIGGKAVSAPQSDRRAY
jgi:PhoPQ-activated pathogenicity-related protein